MNPTLSVGNLPDSQERVLVKAGKGVLVRLPVPAVTADLPLPFPGRPPTPLWPLVPLLRSTFIVSSPTSSSSPSLALNSVASACPCLLY